MKKIFAIVLASAMVLSLAACGSSSSTATEAATQAATQAATEAATEAAAPETEAPAAEAAAPDKVVLGVVASITGSNAEAGRQATQAAKTVEWYINEELGGFQSLGGAQVEIRMIDSTSDGSQSSLPMEQALSTGEICAVAGSSLSAVAFNEMPILQKYKIPAVLGSAANPTLDEQGCDYVFIPAANSPTVSAIKFDFLEYYAGIKGIDTKELKYGIIYENSSWGTDVGAANRDLIESFGLTDSLVYDENYEAGTLTDATSLVTKMKNAGVDILFPGCYANDAKLIASACASMGYSPLFFGDGAGFAWPSFYEAIGDMANGVVSAESFVRDTTACRENAEWMKMDAKYEEMFDEMVCGHGGTTMASLMIICQAIEETGSTDGTVIADKIRTFSHENCEWLKVFGPESYFDEYGYNAGCSATMLQWQDGKTTCIFPAEDAASPILDPLTLEPLN